ncbi:carbonic anhydrase [Caenispirillum salinarum]|nr:carbonic anhydrase family protein [Caenispirillum salinarum]
MMDRRRFLTRAAAAAACPVCAAALAPGRPAGAAEAGGWSYGGATGPTAWGTLDPAWRTCTAGERQSPVDLSGATPSMMATPDIDWPAMPLVIANTGNTIAVEATAYATMGLGLEGARYRMTGFHFHHPSEHTVEGRGFPLEIHFMHEDELGGGFAIAAVFVRSGALNPTLQTIFQAMPAQAGERLSLPTLIPPRRLLPPDDERESFRYQGSLTRPPCTEAVRWLVFTHPIEAAPEQIEAFARLFPMNARPVQPLGRRYLLLDFF